MKFEVVLSPCFQIWSIVYNEDQQTKVEFLANLTRHTKAVNVVRFSPKGELKLCKLYTLSSLYHK